MNMQTNLSNQEQIIQSWFEPALHTLKALIKKCEDYSSHDNDIDQRAHQSWFLFLWIYNIYIAAAISYRLSPPKSLQNRSAALNIYPNKCSNLLDKIL